MKKFTTLGMALLMFSCTAAYGLDLYPQAFEAPRHQVLAVFQQRFARLDHDGNDVGKNKYDSSTEALAYIYRNGQLTAGGAFSYEYGKSKYDFRNRSGNLFDGNGKLREQTFGFNLFAEYRTLNDWYGAGNAFVGFNKSDPRYLNAYDAAGNRRSLTGLDSEHNTMFAASLEAGKYFTFGDEFFLKPHLGVDYAYTPSTNYRYSDGGAWNGISIGSQNYLEVPVGVGIGKAFNSGNWRIVPNLDLTLVNAIGKMDNKNFRPGFSTYTANGWKTYGIAGSHYGGRVSAGIDANLNQKFDLGIDYTYEGRKDYHDHRLSAVFGISF